MEAAFYLVVARSGARKITQTPPKLDVDEIALLVSLKLPNALFERPLLHATITLPPSLHAPEPLSVEIQDTVVASIHQATGLEVRLVVAGPQPPAPEPL